MTEAQQACCWVNGKRQESLSVNDRGLLYGDGFFTTAVTFQHRLLNAEAHWQRLKQSAQRLGFGTLDWQALQGWLHQAMQAWPKNQVRVLKILITRGTGGRGYEPPLLCDAHPTYILQNLPYPQEPMTQDWVFWQNVNEISVAVLLVRWGQNRALAGLKHLNRLENVLARQALREGMKDSSVVCQEGLMLDESDHVISGTQSNLVFQWQDQWWTPKLDRCGVQGTTLTTLRQLAPIHDTEVTLTQLQQAKALFLCNAVRGVMPVSQVWLSERSVWSYPDSHAETHVWQQRWRNWIQQE